MKKQNYDIPPERESQFELITVAAEKLLQWAKERAIGLEYIYPSVPFVETDFTLDAWLFLDIEDRIAQYRADGTANEMIARFLDDLAKGGYPSEWSNLVTCHFASKEVVDRDYQGSYYFFLR